ncbi:carbamoyltransferase C-terminal domain-containing protein [Thermopolyspora sp. NPDC052614]|uniref:carbamoyltransferase C-terminal domain-containing protein n=1 Tax=Thermopolyspora sp. NPDC052614 TaxID=3155682 RepID=UPI003422D1FC
MSIVLGIHCGHESSCAVVRDGRLVAAIQQERVTRRKYDGQECLSARLPIHETLAAAGAAIDDVDVIVSSFQAAGPSAVGLHRPLVSADFDAFDPFDPRHFVVSHHLAHAASAAYTSGFTTATVLVSDLAGTTSRDGRDFHVPFSRFYADYSADAPQAELFTEMRSVYRFDGGRLELLDRAFSRPHNQPDVFVQSEAGLYDNVARFLFRTEHAHGQLMALAGIPSARPAKLVAGDIVTADSPPRLKNGWQRLLSAGPDPADSADVAAAVQEAFTRLLTYHAARAVELAGHPDLCCAGGVFLNLAANSAIAALPAVRDLYVPSCPHDAGISVGAAFLGWARTRPRPATPPRLRCDFLGRPAEPITPEQAGRYGYTPTGPATDPAARAAEVLAEGAIVARYAGRAEFGPRALGNRSLLCHPVTCSDARAKLNRLKRRQGWRPVAPMVREEDVHRYFTGPARSPFMNFNFTVRPEYRELLAEAVHADGTARVQTVGADEAPAVHDLLGRIAKLGLPPVLINTSFNGPGQPIIDSADDALEFVRHPVVDHLLTDETLFATPTPARITVRRPRHVVMAMFGAGEDTRYLLSHADASRQVDRRLFLDLCADGRALTDGGSRAVLDCLDAGLLVEDGTR